MNLLITGGAGYIGAHVFRVATEAGHRCVALDNLDTGNPDRVDGLLVNQDIAAPDAVSAITQLLTDEKIDAVIHLAARKQVGESVEQPEAYYRDNLGGMANLLLAMRAAGVKRLVFSSSAATYGMPDVEEVSEDTATLPINPYGQTKLIGEWMVQNAAVWGLKGVSLRYFNVAGAGWPELADSAPLNLIPIAIKAMKEGGAPIVFGTDYPTADGSCIRDYVHVHDLARAHLEAVSYLDRDERPHSVFNVGTGRGASVLEVLDQLAQASGLGVEPQLAPRRAGDPPKLVADVSRIRETLGFEAHFGLEQIIASAWSASK